MLSTDTLFTLQYPKTQFFDPYAFIESQNELCSKNSYPQVKVICDVKLRFLNYAFSYDVVVTVSRSNRLPHTAQVHAGFKLINTHGVAVPGGTTISCHIQYAIL